ncbi:ATP synthase subunit I [Thioalkalivibrio sp.]|uniref:ATP synthase subunit I n=1 Tax=Thioalkalivibrio sp. TaxID=2093813 RepID=UPI0035652688
MAQQSFTAALQSLALQVGVTLFAAAAMVPISAAWALAALLGGGLAIAGNLLVVMLVFRNYRAADPGTLTTRMMGAELARLALVAAGFALVFVSVEEPAMFSLLGSFLVVHLLPVWWMHRVSDQAMKR